MTSGRGKGRSDLERTNCINATRTDCGTKLWAATRHAPGLGTARVTRFMAGADEPYEGILHVRICGGRRGQPRLLPGSQRRGAPEVCREVAGCPESSAWRGSVPSLGSRDRLMTRSSPRKVLWLAILGTGCLDFLLLLLPAKPQPRTLDFRLAGPPLMTNGAM